MNVGDVNEVVELIESGVDVNDQHWNFLHFAVLPPEYCKFQKKLQLNHQPGKCFFLFASF